jgi:hypothetical protein
MKGGNGRSGECASTMDSELSATRIEKRAMARRVSERASEPVSLFMVRLAGVPWAELQSLVNSFGSRAIR